MKFKLLKKLRVLSVALLAIGIHSSATAQAQVDGVDARTNTSELAIQLGSPDPHVRQRSAEALARWHQQINERSSRDINFRRKTKRFD